MQVLVVYYSLYGHVLQLAEAVVAGVKSLAGWEAVLRRVQEFPDIEQDLPNHPTPWRSGTASKTSRSAPWTT